LNDDASTNMSMLETFVLGAVVVLLLGVALGICYCYPRYTRLKDFADEISSVGSSQVAASLPLGGIPFAHGGNDDQSFSYRDSAIKKAPLGEYDVDLSFAATSPGSTRTEDNPLAYSMRTHDAGQSPPVSLRPPLVAPRPSPRPPLDSERQTTTATGTSPGGSASTLAALGGNGLSPTTLQAPAAPPRLSLPQPQPEPEQHEHPPSAPPRLSVSQPGRIAWPEMSPAPPKLQSRLAPADSASTFPGGTSTINSTGTPLAKFRAAAAVGRTVADSPWTTPRPQGRPDPFAHLRTQSTGPKELVSRKAAADTASGPIGAFDA
jgi:hypothetical protein